MFVDPLLVAAAAAIIAVATAIYIIYRRHTTSSDPPPVEDDGDDEDDETPGVGFAIGDIVRHKINGKRYVIVQFTNHGLQCAMSDGIMKENVFRGIYVAELEHIPPAVDAPVPPKAPVNLPDDRFPVTRS